MGISTLNLHVVQVLVAQSCPAFATPWTVAHQAPLSMEFSRQEYWNGLSFPFPGDLPTQGSNLPLLCLRHWQAGYFYFFKLPAPPNPPSISCSQSENSLPHNSCASQRMHRTPRGSGLTDFASKTHPVCSSGQS